MEKEIDKFIQVEENDEAEETLRHIDLWWRALTLNKKGRLRQSNWLAWSLMKRLQRA